MTRLSVGVGVVVGCLLGAGVVASVSGGFPGEVRTRLKTEKVVKSEEEWRKSLTPEQFRILRKKGTEPAFTGAYWNTKEKGIYLCAGCGNELFSSEVKFGSETGWPSFWEPISPEKVQTAVDVSFFMRRIEVSCARCGGHLGHVFEDGPEPTGLRYCLNSLALKLIKHEEESIER